MVSIPGLGGGLDVQAIVNQILFAERAPVRSLQQKESKINSQAAAYRELKTKLLALSSAADALASSQAASAKAATSSDTTVLTSTASGSAVVGRYSVTVGQLATTDTYASAAFTSQTDTILTGSFDLKVGTAATLTITISPSNNTLTGLRDAINSSGANAAASIVKDGSNYKLAIISKSSGSDNAITLSNFTNPSQQTQLNLTRTVTLQNASLTVNGITLTSSSNSVTDAVQGVTLNLVKAGSSEVTVSADTAKITEAINKFITAYNDANTFFNAQFKYNTTTKSAGVLAGDGTVRRIQSNLQSALSGAVSGLSTPLTNLREVGVSFANDGSISLDSAELSTAITNNATAVANLFMITARFTDARATLVATSSKTQAGTYPLFITRAAEAAEITGTAVVTTLSAAGTITITYKGTEYTTSLSLGQNLSSTISSINSTLQTAGVAVRASDSAGKLKVATQGYGSAESVSVRVSASISTDLGISTSNQTDAGVDVAGTLNGTAGLGTGQTLLAATGGNVEGLAVAVTATAADVGAGLSLGNAIVSVGFGAATSRQVSQATTSITGTIDSALSGLDSRIRDIRDNVSSIEVRLAARQKLLTEELSRADNALREMATKITALNSQLATLR